MNNPKLFFNKTRSVYFLCIDENSLDLKCNGCSKVFELGCSVFIHRSFSKKEYKKGYYCERCIKETKTLIYDEYKSALLTAVKPIGCIFIPDLRPQLSNIKDTSVFDLGKINDKYGSEHKTIDKTRLSCTESIEGAKIGCMPEEQIEKMDRKLSEKEAIDYFGLLQECEVIAPGSNIKIIEDKSEVEQDGKAKEM